MLLIHANATFKGVELNFGDTAEIHLNLAGDLFFGHLL